MYTHVQLCVCVSVSAHVHVHDSGPVCVHVRPSISGSSVDLRHCVHWQCDVHGVCSVSFVHLSAQLDLKPEEGPSGVVV